MIERREIFEEISPSDFFYRNRELAGFTNPARSLYSAIREFVENSLDACELYEIAPKILIRLHEIKPDVYRLRVEDNGPGVPHKMVPFAFAKVLFGSKFVLRQARGLFGLGGTMTILYGQITTDENTHVISSVGDSQIHIYELRIDILKNEPIVMKHRILKNEQKWHGIMIEISLKGDYIRAMPKILEYLRCTSIASPYADITFIDPQGRVYKFPAVSKECPKPAKEIPPHPLGIDIETLRRLILISTSKDMFHFITTYFHRVGRTTAKAFLKSANIAINKKPSNLSDEEIIRMAQTMQTFKGFRSPDASCLSILGESLIRSGIQREFSPEFIATHTRKPSSYRGHPFIVEVTIAYGGKISPGISLYRYANKIPLLYDESSDVCWGVVNAINWKNYGINPEKDSIAVFVYIYSTKIPYKTVGKECIADRPEIEREIFIALRKVCRELRSYLLKRQRLELRRKRLNIYSVYLAKIAKFSTELAGKTKEPDIRPLLESAGK